jgi:hypothetical protein
MKKISRLKKNITKKAYINDEQFNTIMNIMKIDCGGDGENIGCFVSIPINQLPEGVNPQDFINEFNTDDGINFEIMSEIKNMAKEESNRELNLDPYDDSDIEDVKINNVNIGFDEKQIYIETDIRIIRDKTNDSDYEKDQKELLRQYYDSVIPKN